MRGAIVLDAGQVGLITNPKLSPVHRKLLLPDSRFPIPDSRFPMSSLPIPYFLRTLNQINKLSSITL
ncbi:MAG: hypothetical protein F6J98_23825 [Moorea sp. SIO4G2]|nr:hypothetical protein [Moorena sp. SIO4G2]